MQQAQVVNQTRAESDCDRMRTVRLVITFTL
jgi:hypothetical protein